MDYLKLTPKQEFFAQEFIKTGNATLAYKKAYRTENMKSVTINRCAKELIDNPKITARIAELKSQVQEKQLWSREMSVKALVQAYREGSGSVKVAAVKELNAMHGYNEPAKISVNGNLVHKVVRQVIDGTDADD